MGTQISEDKFYDILNRHLTPSTPVKSEEILKGRIQHLDKIHRAFKTPGRNVFIYGVRGVGKTSLGYTAAYSWQSADSEPIYVSCDSSSTFFSVIQSIAEKLKGQVPDFQKSIQTLKASAKWSHLSAEAQAAIEHGRIPVTNSVDEAVSQIEFFSVAHSSLPVVVIDEFDRIVNDKDKALFGDFLKQIGDREVPTKFIFCGIGESLTDLFKGHQSSYRYIVDVQLERLDILACKEIIEEAASKFGSNIDDTYLYRIAQISDGFPYYVHLIGRNFFIQMYEQNRLTKPSAEDFSSAIRQSVEENEAYLRELYEKATHKHVKSEYELILWALANDRYLRRRVNEVFEEYCRIAKELEKDAVSRNNFNNRISRLKNESHGPAIKSSHHGWYEFVEPVLRGYCRLQAEMRGVTLAGETALEG